MEFEFDDKKFLIETPVFAKCKEALDTLPDGKVINYKKLASMTEYKWSYIRSARITDDLELAGYSFTYRNRRWFGNKNTVESWKKQQSRN